MLDTITLNKIIVNKVYLKLIQQRNKDTDQFLIHWGYFFGKSKLGFHVEAERKQGLIYFQRSNMIDVWI